MLGDRSPDPLPDHMGLEKKLENCSTQEKDVAEKVSENQPENKIQGLWQERGKKERTACNTSRSSTTPQPNIHTSFSNEEFRDAMGELYNEPCRNMQYTTTTTGDEDNQPWVVAMFPSRLWMNVLTVRGECHGGLTMDPAAVRMRERFCWQ